MDAETVARMMAAQEVEPDAPEPIETPADNLIISAPAPAFDPGKVDGRTLRKTGREPFATRIKPETHETLRRIAYAKGVSIAEVVEQAVAAFDKTASR